MASNTPNLSLLKKDPLTDGNETFNIQTMMNDNWDKIDTAVKKVQDDVANIDPNIPDASTTTKGIVQLTSSTNSTSETLAATAKAVKTVSDNSFSKTGGTVSGDISISGKSVLAGPVDFRNGIDGLGDIKTTGGLRTNGAINITNKGIVGSGDNNAIPALTWALGDPDTGFNWQRDGYVDFVANGKTVAFMNEVGRFCVRGDGDDYYDVARDIINLKQSGVNAKASIVAAINAMGVAATTEASYNDLSNKIRSINTFKELTASAGTYGGNSALIIPAGFKDAIRIYQTNILYNKWVNAQTLILYLRDSAGRVYELYRSNSSGNNLYGYTVTGININSSRIIVSGTNGASNPNSFNVQINFTNGFNMSDQFYIYNTNSVASASTAGQQTVTTSTAYGS